ncbi:ribosome small subunit-dependent GTPase A [Cyclobacterium qasimii]|uniref:Small ribosomal subunit biogenesis GTPase RsgA n=2 Tax=Cyclobacterium qasimii TaxID=1350429 RepID=S7V7S1_9BACT|nr:ribosome small subunit-dependent GTPase A [Cyclobacterium qasimii]EPR66275.1 Ribosome small subunit-stimulated GTPase EngC [Cyclobacterium qasimii M12-11B]GEO21019.1 putative ribosome biogenesis GTPase RsgA [Cyclobacterium qasimii]
MEGRVIKTTGSWYEVKVGDKMIKARLRGKFKQDNLKLTNPIAVGDYVVLEKENNQETAVINTIVPRENYIIRKSTRKKHFSHILAANVDQAYLMVTVRDPRTSLGFIDRFLVSTESFRIPCTLLVNKVETLTKQKDLDFLEELHDIYGPLGYPIIELSALHDEDLMEKFEPGLAGKTTLMAGHSGVGKSTLLNRLVPQASQFTQEVSKFSSKGVHTTTFAEMFPFGDSGYFIDTPGIKEFGILDVDDQELSHYFVELRKYLGQCKYNNCKHINEPGCKVLEVLEQGYIHPYRYENYLKIMNEEDSHR